MPAGPMETDAPKVKAHKGKGTTTVTLDFVDSDDDVFDEEVENARASCLTESAIDVNTGEKVACQLEKGVSTGNFSCYFVFFDLNFSPFCNFHIFNSIHFFVEYFFLFCMLRKTPFDFKVARSHSKVSPN
jgi:hypothetical protein